LLECRGKTGRHQRLIEQQRDEWGQKSSHFLYQPRRGWIQFNVVSVKYYSCCSEPFTVSLRRVAAFYNYVLVLPCVLLSFLTLVIFWLPPESPAKMMLGTHASWQSTTHLLANIVNSQIILRRNSK